MKSQIAAEVEFVRLPRESLEQRVTELLRELIVSGELPEGTPLVQRELAHRIGFISGRTAPPPENPAESRPAAGEEPSPPGQG